jgi:hypothetical protein
MFPNIGKGRVAPRSELTACFPTSFPIAPLDALRSDSDRSVPRFSPECDMRMSSSNLVSTRHRSSA